MTGTRQHTVDEDEFQAFVDGHLSPERRRAVMAYLAANAGEAARMSAYRSLNEALHLTYDEVGHEALPPRLRVERYVGRGGFGAAWSGWLDSLRPWAPRIAGLAMVALTSGVVGWSLNDRMGQPLRESEAAIFTRSAAHAHMLYAADLNYPVEFGADQQDSLLLWLSERLGEPVHAPTLADLGYSLVGGRLLPSAGQPAAQLMYQNAQAGRMTLYIRSRWPMPAGALQGAQEAAVHYAGEDDGVSMVYWLEGPFAYALIGQMDREQLSGTARLVQEQLQIPTLVPVPVPTETTDQVTEKKAT